MTRFTLLLIIAVTAFSVPAFGQLDLPALSPKAQVMQTVGLTDITIDYYSPGVRGREGKIWGGLVPYDKVWRMGANSSTKVTFSKDVTIEGKTLKAGTYAIGAIPGQNEWTIIFSKDPDMGGWGDYSPDKHDALRVNVKPVKSPQFRERLHFIVSDFNNETARLDMEWENLRVPINIGFDTYKQAEASINRSFSPTWSQYNSAARYLMETGKDGDLDKAMTWADKSIATQEHWFNTWTKAQILAKKGKYKEAAAMAEKAYALGTKPEQNFFFKDEGELAMKEWKNKK